jgi:selenide,water dikinase
MLTINRRAAEAARGVGGVHACTDVTGFGLLGHASEVAIKSGVGIQIEAGTVPVLPNATTYVGGSTPAGLRRNRDYFPTLGGGITIDPAVAPDLAALLFDPQTSGGLLFAVAADRLPELAAAFTEWDVPHWVIGKVVAGSGITVSA